MRPIYLSIYVVTAFASISTAQLNLTVYRNPTLSDSVTLRWQIPPGAVPPLFYELYSSFNFGGSGPPDTFSNRTSLVLPISIGGGFYSTRYFSLTATDSAGEFYHSDTCGYLRFIAVGAPEMVSTPFGIPFVTWDVVGGVPQFGIPSSDPSDVMGDQSNCDTPWFAGRILRQENGEFAVRNQNAGCGWTHMLQYNHNMIATRAYWYQNRYYQNRTIVLCGDADVTTLSPPVTVVGRTGTNAVGTPYSWRDPRSRNRGQLQLLSQGFCGGTIGTADRVLSQVAGAFFWYRTSDSTWQGASLEVRPGETFWIQRRCTTDFVYTYDPTSDAP